MTEPTPPAAPDYGTPLGLLRLRIADTAEPYALGDGELRGLLAARGITSEQAAAAVTPQLRGRTLQSAADALLIIAASETLIGKYIRQADGTTTDGTKVGAELRAQAALLRAEGDLADAEAADDDGTWEFGVVEFRPGVSW